MSLEEAGQSKKVVLIVVDEVTFVVVEGHPFFSIL